MISEIIPELVVNRKLKTTTMTTKQPLSFKDEETYEDEDEIESNEISFKYDTECEEKLSEFGEHDDDDDEIKSQGVDYPPRSPRASSSPLNHMPYQTLDTRVDGSVKKLKRGDPTLTSTLFKATAKKDSKMRKHASDSFQVSSPSSLSSTFNDQIQFNTHEQLLQRLLFQKQVTNKI